VIKKLIVALIISFSSLTFSEAQDSLTATPQHLLSLSTGLSNHMVRDDIMSPFVYGGSQLPILLNYDYRGIIHRHTITAFYDNLELTSSITDKGTSSHSHFVKNLNFFLEYSYDRKAFTFEQINTECFLGGMASAILNPRILYYSNQNGEFSGDFMMNLAFDALLETKLDKSSEDFLSFHICVPLISYVLLDDIYNSKISETFDLFELEPDKNPLGQMLTKGHFVTLDRLFKLQTEIFYTMFVGGSVGFEFQYRFEYYSFAEYKNLFYARCINNQVLAGFIVIL
jgi:hypothetical protein